MKLVTLLGWDGAGNMKLMLKSIICCQEAIIHHVAIEIFYFGGGVGGYMTLGEYGGVLDWEFCWHSFSNVSVSHVLRLDCGLNFEVSVSNHNI